jgi:enamine deaminase RidA (YjgF/YER057c/UK114 family)
MPRERWPALTVVQAPTGERRAVDAIAAPEAGGRRIVTDGAVRLGEWVFVGALCGEGADIERQAHSVFKRIQATLAEAGAQLRDVVKVGGWLTFPMADYEPLGRVRSELVQHGLLPASAAVQVQAPCTGGDGSKLLAFEAVAFTGKAHRPGGASRLAPYYATARSAGGYVFTCGEIARKPGPVEAQLRDVYEQLEAHLSEHGSALGDALAQTLYVRSGHDLREVAREARTLLAPAQPCTTVLPAADMGFRTGVEVEIELVTSISR